MYGGGVLCLENFHLKMPEAVTAIPKKTVGMETFKSFENVARWIKISLEGFQKKCTFQKFAAKQTGHTKKVG